MAQRGFSLVEVLLAGALFTVVALGAFEALRQTGENARRFSARNLAVADLERLTARLRSEARTASAVRVTAGEGAAALAGHDDCRELAFFTADASGPQFWAYRWYPNHDDHDAIPGDALARVTGNVGPCAPADAGEIVLRGVAAGGVTLRALALDDAPFVTTGLSATVIALGVRDASGTAIGGGNAPVELSVATNDAARTVDLVAGVFPSGWTHELAYTCTQRCDVPHPSAAAQRLNRCALAGFWYDPSTYPLAATFTYDGPDASGLYTRRTTGWYWAGYFIYHYADAGTSGDAYDDWVPIATFDSAGRNAVPYATPDADPAAWLARLAPYLSTGSSAAIATAAARCADVEQTGVAGGFYAN